MRMRVVLLILLAVFANLLLLPVELLAQGVSPRVGSFYGDAPTIAPAVATSGGIDMGRADQLIERFSGMLETMGESAGVRARQLPFPIYALLVAVSNATSPFLVLSGCGLQSLERS